MDGFDAVVLAQDALGLVPEVLNTVDMTFSVGEEL